MHYSKETCDKIKDIIKEETQRRDSTLKLLRERMLKKKTDIHQSCIDKIEEKSLKWGFFSTIAEKYYMVRDYQKITFKEVQDLGIIYHCDMEKINEQYENNIKIKTSKIIKDVESSKNNVLTNIVKLGFYVFMFLCFCTLVYLCNNQI